MIERDEHGKFIKGGKGGPGRPPKDRCISDLMSDMLVKDSPEFVRDSLGRRTKKHMTYLQAFVFSQVTRAINGDAAAARNLWERVEGKVLTSLEVSGIDGGPIPVEFYEGFKGV